MPVIADNVTGKWIVVDHCREKSVDAEIVKKRNENQVPEDVPISGALTKDSVKKYFGKKMFYYLI